MATCTTRPIVRMCEWGGGGPGREYYTYYGHEIPEHVSHLTEDGDIHKMHYVLRWRTYRGNIGEMVIRDFDGEARLEDVNAAIVAMKLTD